MPSLDYFVDVRRVVPVRTGMRASALHLQKYTTCAMPGRRSEESAGAQGSVYEKDYQQSQTQTQTSLTRARAKAS